MSQRQRSAASGRRRSAMGEFLPESGERPLSSYGQPTPSAFDYYPSIKSAMPTSPSYSLHSRPATLSREVTPAPSKYSTRKDSKQKIFTMTRKGITRPYDIREHAHITCTPGAGHYHRVNGDIGSSTKRSMSARHRDGLHVGYPNSLIQPVDTMGFATPGPTLQRKRERGTSAMFARLTFKEYEEIRKKKEDDNDTDNDIKLVDGPGPAAYNLPTPMSMGKTIGQKLHIDHELHYPSPNTYTIPETVGTGVAKGFGAKNNVDTDQQFPSPATYSIPRPFTAAHSFNYRPFPTPVKEGPSPAHYTRTNSALPTAPDYTCHDKCKPAFPDVLLYPEYTTVGTPGAGDYEYDCEFVDNSAPKYSHGLPLPVKPNTNPGPNHYHVRHEPTQKRLPSYSIVGRSSNDSPHSTWPSPADYSVKQRPSSAISITPRRNKVMSSSGPAPNHYHLSGTRHGHSHGHMASMKSRRSTVCYSGFPSSHLSRLASLAT